MVVPFVLVSVCVDWLKTAVAMSPVALVTLIVPGLTAVALVTVAGFLHGVVWLTPVYETPITWTSIEPVAVKTSGWLPLAGAGKQKIAVPNRFVASN